MAKVPYPDWPSNPEAAPKSKSLVITPCSPTLAVFIWLSYESPSYFENLLST